jgi:curved DNA-binding protein
MEYRDYYATLGVPRTATQAEIKRAFRKLARQHHPDVNTGDAAAERRFKEVSEAHEVLSDPEKRKLYDRLGKDWEAYQRAGAGAPDGDPFAGFQGGTGGFRGGYPGGGVRFEFHGDPEDLEGFSDFFRTFFAGSAAGPTGSAGSAGSAGGGIDLESLLRGSAGGSAGMGGGRRRTAQDGRARDVAAETELTLEEVATGTGRLVQVGDRRLEVTVPPGVESGQRIRLSGRSGSGGDLYITVRVLPHPVFTRDGADLQRELPLTLGEALLGAQVPVATIGGRTLLLTIPPGTQQGRLFRLAGQGLPRFRQEGRGDLLVRARVVLPGPLDEEGARLAQALADHVRQPDPRIGSRSTPRQPLETPA